MASDNDFGARISTVPDGVRHLRQPYPVGYATPKVDIFKKKGIGIRSRSFYHVPLKTISRRITHADNQCGRYIAKFENGGMAAAASPALPSSAASLPS